MLPTELLRPRSGDWCSEVRGQRALMLHCVSSVKASSLVSFFSLKELYSRQAPGASALILLYALGFWKVLFRGG